MLAFVGNNGEINKEFRNNFLDNRRSILSRRLKKELKAALKNNL